MSGVGDRLNSILSSMVECLRSQIAADDPEGTPPLCFVDRLPGDAAVADYAGYGCEDGAGGMAWVRLVSVYPAQRLGQPNEQPGNCSQTIGMDIELGILREIGVGDEAGNPPEPEEVVAASALATNDALTMWRSVACCVDKGIFSRDEYRMSPYVPSGPLGGLVGGSYIVQVVL